MINVTVSEKWTPPDATRRQEGETELWRCGRVKQKNSDRTAHAHHPVIYPINKLKVVSSPKTLNINLATLICQNFISSTYLSQLFKLNS